MCLQDLEAGGVNKSGYYVTGWENVNWICAADGKIHWSSSGSVL